MCQDYIAKATFASGLQMKRKSVFPVSVTPCDLLDMANYISLQVASICSDFEMIPFSAYLRWLYYCASRGTGRSQDNNDLASICIIWVDFSAIDLCSTEIHALMSSHETMLLTDLLTGYCLHIGKVF